jgi:RecB family endonuclease NucS
MGTLLSFGEGHSSLLTTKSVDHSEPGL